MDASLGSILIIDDDQSVCLLLQQILETGGYHVTAAATGEQGMAALKRQEYPVVLLDMHLPDSFGLDLIARIHEQNADASVIVITGFASVETAVQAIKSGAYDYLQKPLHVDSVKLTVEKGLERSRLLSENKYLHQTLDERYGFEKIIAKSKPMMLVFDLIRKVSDTSTTVLVQGESGTGKELVARALHFNSKRRQAKFVPLNCGGIPENLLESELFGYVRGAFTGAVGSKQGLFQRADRGTIFLDEIATLPLVLQVKLLRVLQEGTFYPLGGTTPVEVDIRVVAATNIDLESAVKSGAFREDLYYRLSVVPLTIPPLRKRTADIPPLVAHFMDKFGAGTRTISAQAMEALVAYQWPGNVRELENTIERITILSHGDVIEAEDLPAEVRLGAGIVDAGSRCFVLPEGGIDLEETELDLVRQALERAGGAVPKAAKLLGLTTRTLEARMERYGL